jgi:hypothetical protein
MTVGVWFGLESHSQHDAVNEVLARHELPQIAAEERHVALGRSKLDHHGARALAELAERGGKGRRHLFQMVAFAALVYVPRDLRVPTSVTLRGAHGMYSLHVGSSRYLLAELVDLAPALGISLDQGVLSDGTARQINDECDTLATAWLLLHEAARLSIDLDAPFELR